MKLNRKYLLLGLAVAVIALAFLAMQVNAQNQSADDLAQRLKQRGVPVKSVGIVSRVPFHIEITLQSSGKENSETLDDNNAWFMLLAEREATLAYRFDLRVDSYILRVINAKGEQIAWGQHYLYPSDLNQQLGTPVPPKVDNATTKQLIAERLQFGEMSVDRLDVVSDTLPGSIGQILLIELSVTDLDAANRSLPRFMDSLRRMLDTINTEQGTRLILCRLKLVDRHGRVLFTFMRDIEVGHTKQGAVKELDGGPFIRRGPPTPVPTGPAPTPQPYPGPK